MDIDNILECLKTSIRDVYKKEKDYFTPIRGRERDIVFRIAHILANKIEKNRENTEHIFVDIEANRCNECIKTNIQGEKIVPDLIIHVRNGTSYVVAEFKCSARDETEDKKKLKDMTTVEKSREQEDSKCPHYDLGVFIHLMDEEVEYTLFENGKETKTGSGILWDSKTFKWNPEKIIERRIK